MSITTKTTVQNPQAASLAMGESLELIKLCVNKNAPGCNTNRTINTKKLREYIELNRIKLEEELEDSLPYWRKEKIKEEVKKLRRDLISPEDVTALLTALATTITSVLNRLDEIPLKAAGKTEPEIKLITDKYKLDILTAIKDKAKINVD